MITTYDEFAACLRETGFLALGGKSDILSLSDLTPREIWHTGLDTDPWEYRRIIVTRGDGAFTRLSDGRTVFISNEWHPIFISACRDEREPDEIWASGEMTRGERDMRALFTERPVWPRHELRERLGERGLDASLKRLLSKFVITVSGETQRFSDNMRPLGWPSTEYARLDAFRPEAVALADALDPAESREKISAQRRTLLKK